MSAAVDLLGEKGAALIDEHVQRFSIMVNEGMSAVEAVGKTVADLVEAVGMGEKAATTLLWMAVLDLTCDMSLSGEGEPT